MSSKRRNTRCAFVAGVQTYSLPISLPGILWIGAMAALTGDYDLGTTAFLNWAFGSETWDERWRFWFLEALVWILLGTAVLFKIGRSEERSVGKDRVSTCSSWWLHYD